MEHFEQIRHDSDREGLSIRALAERHGVHRRVVRAALESSVPPPKRRPVGRPAPKLGEYRERIDEWLLLTDGTDSYRLAQATAGKGVRPPRMSAQRAGENRWPPVGRKHGRHWEFR